MGKKYTTDEIHVGGHNLNASMMVDLNTVVSNHTSYLTTATGLEVFRSEKNIDDQGTYMFAQDDGGWTGGNRLAGAHNGYGVISMHLHSGDYHGQIHLSSQTGDMGVRFQENSTTWSSIYTVHTSKHFSTADVAKGVTAHDLLDGLDSTQFIRSDANDETGSGIKTWFGGAIDPNSGATIQVNGFQRTGNIYLHSGGNSPDTARNSDYLGNSGGDLYWNKSGVGNGKVWTSVSDGSGSGLDADTLDGQHASAFAAVSHTHTWANIYGETFNSVNEWGGLRHQTNNGYIDFGPANSGHAHIYTDRPNFYFNKPLTVNGSSIINAGDIRSNIFYDIDNTGYYLNPASTSRTNNITGDIFSGVISTSGDGQNNYPFRLASDYNSYMVAAANNTWGLFWAGNSGARYGTNGQGGPGNIWGNSTNPNEFVFVGSDSTKWTLHGSTGKSWQAGSGQSAVDFRAPIFYDSNNTGYYLNPASTSNLNGLTVTATITGNISGNADTVDGHHASTTRNSANTIPIRDVNGYINLGWINTTSGNTNSTLSDIYVNTNDGYIRKATPAHFRSQITDGNYLPIGGKAADSNLLDGLDSTNYMRDNGWNSSPGQNADTQPTMSSDFTYGNNAPHTGDLIRFGSSGYSLQLNATYNSTAGGLSFRSFNNDGAQAWNPWRTIYHSGNFNPSSYLTTTGKAADSELLDGIDSTQFMRSDISNAFFSGQTSALSVENYGTFARLAFNELRFYEWDNGGDNLILNNGHVSSDSSFRAPIFYDSNNTGYYGNFASNSRYNTAQGNYLGLGTSANTSGGYRLNMGGSIDMNNNTIDYAAQLHFNDNVRFYDDGNDSYLNFKYGDANNGGIKVLNGASELKGYLYGANNEFGLLDSDGQWAVRTQTGTNPLELRCDNNTEFQVYNSYTISPGSSRAPIFYDSDNTGYYLNPAGTSNINELNVAAKRTDFSTSTNWDAVGFGAMTNLHMQGHNQFWLGAGNGTWFTGAANVKTQESGLATDASAAHDLLITTMQGTSSTDRGITFGVDTSGTGTDGWRLGKWHSGTSRAASLLAVDGTISAKGGYTDEYDYYANDYSTYHSSGRPGWPGDSNAGWHKPSIVASSAIQIQSGNLGTNSRKPQIQFHQYGYGGPGIEYDGPNKRMTLGELGTSNPDRINSFHFRFDNTDRAIINSDYMFHNSDMRAPLFYDSNNTAYYLNPASTSNINTLNAETINRDPIVSLSGDVTGNATMTNLGSINITTTVGNDSHTHDGRYYTETEIDSQNINLNETLAALSGWVPAFSNSDDSSLTWDRTEDALRIKSDSDTTIGAVHKAMRVKEGMTIRVTVTVKGDVAGSDGLYLRLQKHDGNLPDGKTHVSHSASNSSQFVQEDDSEINNWYENSAISTDWVTHEKDVTIASDGYISLLILNWAGNSTNSIWVKTPDIQIVSSSYLPLTGGTLTGDITVGSGQTNSTIIMADGDGTARRLHTNSNRIGFLNSSNNWGAYCSNNGDWTTDFVGYAGASMRAPIFYDSNNTGRYVDPAGTSSMLNINMNNGSLTNVNNITINDPGASEGIQWNGGSGWRIYESPDNMSNAGGNLQFSIGTSYRFRVDTSGNTYSSTSSRAPIFYDSDNTNFYLQPSDTSYLQDLDISGGLDVVGSTYTNGLIQSSNSMRAPIFYDSDNTSYYLNPAGTSTLNGVKYINNTIPIVVKVNSGFKSWAHHISSNDDYVLAPSTTDGSENWSWNNGFNFKATGDIMANNFLLRSDERLKTKITDLPCDNIDVAWKSFELKSDEGNYRTGVIAQELEKTNPEFVDTDDKGFKSVKYVDLLIAKIAELEARLEKLEK